MRRSIASLALVTLLVPAACLPADEPAPRKPHPFAPSIPELTEEEEKKIDQVIDRFILYDIGRLRGPEGQQAAREFAKLGPEAIPALLRGLRRAAEINHSCPVTVIATKLGRLLGASQDTQLLQFARDEIGTSYVGSPHRAVLQDLSFGLMVRRNNLLRAGIGVPSTVRPATPDAPAARTLKTDQLIEEAGKERGDRLKQLLFELGNREGEECLNTLGVFASGEGYERDVQQVARNALVVHLTRGKPETLKERLTDEKAEVRLAAVKVIRNRGLRWGDELIARLDDEDATVREWAQTTLIKLARGVDLGPPRNATTEQRQLAMQRWRAWWERQPKPAAALPPSPSR